MIQAQNFLKINRERTGLSLQDMAQIIGYDIGNLSKVESGKLDANMRIALAYHLILKVPLERLFKYHYPEVTYQCLQRTDRLKELLSEGFTTPSIEKRIEKVDIILDRLNSLHQQYGTA